MTARIGNEVISDPSDLKILETFHFENGTSADEEGFLHAIESKKGNRGYFIVGFGGGIDSLHAQLINDLLKKEGRNND